MIRPATPAELHALLLAGQEYAGLPPARITFPDRYLRTVEIECDSVPDGDAWAGWLDTDPVPFAGIEATCWLTERSGWIVIVSAPVPVLVTA
jgi:hypothetical protein